MINLKSKQRGVFSIEFALVSVVLGMLLLFTMDVVVKLSMKGKLDRLSFSAVSLVKERTQLYESNYSMVEPQDAILVYNTVKNSLSRTTGNFDESSFGMRLEHQTYTDKVADIDLPMFSLGTGCVVNQSLSNIENGLSVVTTWGRKSTLYRVTLCYETDDMVSGVLGNGFTTVSSSSVILGR